MRTPIAIDGDLSDPAWQQAAKVTTWYETNPGDNLEPKVGNLAWLAYDERFFYAAFEFKDPNPKAIKAPLGDRDNVPSYTDYGGVIVDPRNDGKTAQMFLANPKGIQYDAISSDAAGEDSAPDFFWDSAGRITESGWVLEMRIPFSSLRYEKSDPEQWRIMLYRNLPREFRYQMFTSRLPRDSTCFICNTRPLVGLGGLPSGSHWVVAPFATGNQVSLPEGGQLGGSLSSEDPVADGGLDAKWVPNPNLVFDGTLNPDFSQIESDVAQISANERFALFFPTAAVLPRVGGHVLHPLQAIYTRTFNQPRWGARSTGQLATPWTLMVGEDEGTAHHHPGVNGSGTALADSVAGRHRRTGATSARASRACSTAARDDGGGSNRVFGPDFRWNPTQQDTVTGQLLLSQRTPRTGRLGELGDGRSLDAGRPAVVTAH